MTTNVHIHQEYSGNMKAIKMVILVVYNCVKICDQIMIIRIHLAFFINMAKTMANNNSQPTSHHIVLFTTDFAVLEAIDF